MMSIWAKTLAAILLFVAVLGALGGVSSFVRLASHGLFDENPADVAAILEPIVIGFLFRLGVFALAVLVLTAPKKVKPT
jgi:hypothetical protein